MHILRKNKKKPENSGFFRNLQIFTCYKFIKASVQDRTDTHLP